jgi:lipoate-protein ligase A
MNATDAVNRAISYEIGEGPTADALRALAVGSGGGDSAVTFPGRYDLSVNSARVEGAAARRFLPAS